MILNSVLLLLSAVAVLLVKKPVHASLCFLVTLLSLAGLYIELAAPFLAVIQILIYAGAILVLFMFVIILFQDAYPEILKYPPGSSKVLLGVALVALLAVGSLAAVQWHGAYLLKEGSVGDFASVQVLGEVLYKAFFFPFEAVIFLFLSALIGSLYMAKREW